MIIICIHVVIKCCYYPLFDIIGILDYYLNLYARLSVIDGHCLIE